MKDDKQPNNSDPVLSEIKTGVIILLIIAFIGYLLGALISASLNIADWPKDLRCVCALMFVITSVLTAIFVSSRIDDLY